MTIIDLPEYNVKLQTEPKFRCARIQSASVGSVTTPKSSFRRWIQRVNFTSPQSRLKLNPNRHYENNQWVS